MLTHCCDLIATCTMYCTDCMWKLQYNCSWCKVLISDCCCCRITLHQVLGSLCLYTIIYPYHPSVFASNSLHFRTTHPTKFSLPLYYILSTAMSNMFCHVLSLFVDAVYSIINVHGLLSPCFLNILVLLITCQDKFYNLFCLLSKSQYSQ